MIQRIGAATIPVLPDLIVTAWDNYEGPAVFSTLDGNGNPNAVYVTCARIYGSDRIAIADNYFDKTRKNILEGSGGAFLFITKERKAYQIKGSISYQATGEIRDYLKNCLDPKYPVHAAAVLMVEEAYSGAEKLI